MKQILKSLIIPSKILVILLSQQVQASNSNVSFDTCMDKSQGVTIDMLNCIDIELTREDNRLNTAYQRKLSTLNNREQDSLRRKQRAWIKERDRFCQASANKEKGGTLERVIYNGCLEEKTETRANELER